MHRVRTSPGIICEHNCLSLATAAAEMRAVAAQNVRVKDPVYHVVLSWPSGETPSDDEAFACAHHAIKSVGMDGHQYVYAIHRDTAHVHAHLAVNRVNPETFRAVYPDRDFYKLDRAMRELELQFGWRHDKGPYAVFERDGKRVIDWGSSSPETKGHMPTAAADMERHSDRESFFSYVRGEPRRAVVEALKNSALTWAELHAVLARFGLALREKGHGFAIVGLSDGNDDTAGFMVKASDLHEELSKPRLVKRLGSFEPALAADVPPEQVYDKFRPPMRNRAGRDQHRQERADARRQLQARYADYLAAFGLPAVTATNWRERFAALRDEARRRRTAVRASIPDRNERRAMLSIIAFETARERQRLRELAQRERDVLQSQYASARQSYPDWVGHQAAAGDASAISQLRGWAYGQKRLAAAEGPESITDACVLRPGVPPGPHAPANLPGMSFTVRRNGSVSYKVGKGRRAFIDHEEFVEVPAGGDRHSVLAALLFAADRYGMAFSIEGEGMQAELIRESIEQFPSVSSLYNEWRRSLHDLAQKDAVLQSPGITGSRPRVER